MSNTSDDIRTLSRSNIAGIPFLPVSPVKAVTLLHSYATKPLEKGVHVHMLSAHPVGESRTQPELKKIYQDQNGICLPDGKPLTWISRLKGDRPSLRHVRGPQLFEDSFDASRDGEISHYLLGGRPEVLDALMYTLPRKFPGLRIAGGESPPFRKLTDEELEAQDERIRFSGARIVWVGLGAPKQDFEAFRISQSLPVVAVGVGAAFDFAAGASPMAPPWMSRVGLEWLFRLLSEPRRLWRRYTIGNLRFIRAVMEFWHD